MMEKSDLANVKSSSSHVHIHRADTSLLDLSISNSRVVVEDGGRILTPRHSNPDSFETFQSNQLERGLKARHVSLLSLGGAIGTGLFVGSGSALSTCGPASLVLSYAIMSSVVYFVMQMLAEMTTFLPLPGSGAQSFVNDYLSESFGFAIGWNYWYAFSILVAAEVTAAAIVVQYWITSVNIAVWITIFLVLIILLNIISVRFFGEAEFWFASIKLITLTGLIILGVVLFFGGGPSHDRLGFRYWKHSPFKEHIVGGSTGRFLGIWTAIVKSGFAFICSPELVAAAGGECRKPRRNIPKAARRFIYRLVFFYILGTLVISVIVSSKNPRLLSGSSDASASPFVIGIQNAGIPVLNHIINAAILTSAASAGNSFLYSASRSLYSISCRGLAPKIFSKVNRFGVPVYAVALSSALGFLAYLNVSSSSANAFNWFSNLTTISGFISWILVAFAYLRWRRAIAYHGLSDRVTYKSPFQPFGAYYVIFFISLLSITNGYAVFFNFNGPDFVAAYITLPIVVFLYVGHRAWSYFTKGQQNWLRPIKQIDVITGLDLIEEEDANEPEPVPKNLLEKIWFWVA
ncbi:Proline specific permease [Scheffersomyces stipitis CBS 6054]|uniref:Proline specific permease n=1 Tax=Scheffersomyces stipitis (strain ATCC 58785 / CBS 6054 / NBRC 10063 / NRRL Y-11545) TaxID=322104 RepID=A3GGS5_PICST|nr:Proline specific permease [Scheffersomyces stipitis CBS 6054]EAZ63582.2 Proline specific permease [Scheffersomyces stipitis CBS 6054]KAG2735109.1 hypothetical protein G9P44_001323 [Scheffersomyces stipitis]